MSINPRRKKNSKRKYAAYILLLGILGVCVFFLNTFLVLRRPLFLSPLGRITTNPDLVEKILKKNSIPFSSVTFSEDYYLVNIQNNGQVRLSQNKDVSQQIASLQRILRELTIEVKPFKSIDFRFSEPIVVF